MNKIDILIGLILGLLGTFVGCFLFITLFTDYDFIQGAETMKSKDELGKLITLGTIVDLAMFFVLLKLKKELMARGVILAVILSAILTLII